MCIREPARHLQARLARRHAEAGVVLLVGPDMRRRDSEAHARFRRRDVEHHQILRQRQWSLVVFANVALDFRRGVEIVEEMIDHRKPWLHQGKNASGLFGRGMRHGADAAGHLLVITRALHQLRDRVETFVNQQIGILRVVDEVPARRGVAGEDEGQPIPFEPVADRAVVDVHGGKAFDHNAIVLIDDAGLPIVEFVHLDLGSRVGKETEARLRVPCERLHLQADEVLDAVLGFRPRGPVHNEWLDAARRPSCRSRPGRSRRRGRHAGAWRSRR